MLPWRPCWHCCRLRGPRLRKTQRIWQKGSLMVKYHWIPSSTSTRARGSWLTCAGWRSRSCRKWCWRDRDFLRFSRRHSPGQPSPRQPLPIPTKMRTLLPRWCRGGSRPLRPSRARLDASPLPSRPPWAQDQLFLTPVLHTRLSRRGREQLSPRARCPRRDAQLSLCHPILHLFPRDHLAFHHILALSSSKYLGAPDFCIGAYISFSPIRDLL